MSLSDTPGDSNIGTVTIICGWTFSGLATVAVSLLLWSRRLRHVRPEADDYILIVAYILTIVLMAQTTWAIIDEGQGQHVFDVPRTQLALIASSLLANETLWGIVNTLIRVSVLLFTKRIIWRIRHVRYFLNGLIVFSLLYCAVIVLEIFLICRPLTAAWDTNINGECGHEVVSYVILEIAGLFLDLAILIVPLPTVWGLRLSLKAKIRATCLFSAGALVIVITGLRIQALHMVISTDFTYSRGYLCLLSVLGALLSIIACCAPCLLPVLEHKKVRAFLDTVYNYRDCFSWRLPVRTTATSTRSHMSTVLARSQMSNREQNLEAGMVLQEKGSTLHDASSAVTVDTISTYIDAAKDNISDTELHRDI